MFVFLADFSPAAHATYVEGKIAQDVVWALIDSPFIVINNVTVLPGVTLTIEPGVEVRFGGNFSLTILGKLVAEGTKDRMITFTSNKHVREAGDWIGINFSGVSESYMSYCVVEYAVNGIIVKNSSLEISNCEIANNLESGLKIIGNSSLTVINSKIMLNNIGVTPVDLNVNSSQQATLQNTTISSNSFSGIYINSPVQNFNIINCSIMSNDVGIYISGETNVNITYNSIAYNEIGVFYASPSPNTPINYNDIYNNTLAMQLANSTIGTDTTLVNATYNYWGAPSGPYHPSLNPDGKGNPIESNGIDVDFIPFLSHSVRYLNNAPIARLLTDKVTVAPNQEVLFIATNSSDDGRIDYYNFDFGDGQTSGWTTLSVFTHKYAVNGSYTAKLTVLDDFGVKSSNPAEIVIDVQNLPILDVSLTLSQYSVGFLKNVSVVVHVESGGIPIENASIRLLSIKGGFFALADGYTNSTGDFVTVFMAPNVTKATNLMLIATASKSGYADGADHKYLEVLPALTVNLEVEPKIVKSNEVINVNVSVTHLDEPVSDATVRISADGFLEEGITDSNGTCKFAFAAPAVKEETNLTINVVASKEGYENGTAQTIVVVEPRNMTVQINVSPQTIFSNEESTISVYVSYEELPLADAQINISASVGSLSQQIGFTDLYGGFECVYTAPIVYEETVVTLNITISKEGYVDVTTQSSVTVKPKVLNVEVNAVPETVISERTLNLSVYVTFNGQPVSNVNVSVTSSFGNLSASSVTNLDGVCKFVFTAPAVNQEINVTFFIVASKIGYVEGNSSITVTLKPGILNFDVNINPIVATSGEGVTLTVHVWCDEFDVENVLVTVISDIGNFSKYTNSSGLCTFTFYAPEVTEYTPLTLLITASKEGYVDGQGTFYLDVVPSGGAQGGLPTTFIIIGVAIIAIAVIVALLIKFGIIEIGAEEEKEVKT